jgi:hypothetical protein
MALLKKFLVTADPRKVFELIGKAQYDLWRPTIIDLRVVWGFVTKNFTDRKISTISYMKFLEFRDVQFLRHSDLFPHSTAYDPLPKYTPVSSIVE